MQTEEGLCYTHPQYILQSMDVYQSTGAADIMTMDETSGVAISKTLSITCKSQLGGSITTHRIDET